jgi:GDPmannose 4,6-dehydratase
MAKNSLVTGITGQDGALIAKMLLESGQKVSGLFRRSSSDNFWRLRDQGILNSIELIEADIESYGGLSEVLGGRNFNSIFHLAGSSFTAESFRKPWQTFSVNSFAVFHLLEAVKNHSPESLVILASSSEIFGSNSIREADLTRKSDSFFGPTNPYGLSHLSNLQVADYYRKIYDLRIAVPIMFNHESEFRGDQFLSKKLTSGAVGILDNPEIPIHLGNLEARKDWGSAREFMQFLLTLSDLDFSGNFSLGTGKLTSVREILCEVFTYLGIELEFIGSGLNERALNASTGKVVACVDPRNLRVRETLPYKADPQECLEIFGRSPVQTVLNILPAMIEFDLKKRART